jgi:hypothetical protein
MPKEYIILVTYMLRNEHEVHSAEIAVAIDNLEHAVKRAKESVFGAHPEANRDTDFRFVKIYYEMGDWTKRGSMKLYWDEKNGLAQN